MNSKLLVKGADLLKHYVEYFKYTIEHKRNVFIDCWNEGLYVHAFTHDLSKFLPSEFFPYANKFFKKDDKNAAENKELFNKAWKKHYTRNKHHPEHWVGRDMPIKHIKQMVCDLKAMSRKFGGSAQEYYLNNYYKWDITPNTRYYLEIHLDLIYRLNGPVCECNEEYWMTIEDMIDKGINVNDFLKHACLKYKLDIEKLVKTP